MTCLRLLMAGLAVLALTACNGPDAPEPQGSGTNQPSAGTSPGSAAAQTTAQQLTQELLEGEEAPPPVATAKGALTLDSCESPVQIDILTVQTSETSTLLRWRLRSGTGKPVRVYTSSLSGGLLFDTRGLALVDAVGQQRLKPFTYIQQAGGSEDSGCVCSGVPVDVGETGVQMYALFPPLAPDATSVDVLIPGLPAVEKVAVTR